MREYLSLRCSECKNYNYRTSLETTGGAKLELKKFCRHCRKHTLHRSSKK